MTRDTVVLWKCDTCGYSLLQNILKDLPEGWWEHDDYPDKHFHSLGCTKRYVRQEKAKEREQ